MKANKKVKILALAATVLISSNVMVSKAAVCPTSPSGVHEFCACVSTGVTRTVRAPHPYLYGHDSQGNPIYETCYIETTYVGCKTKCAYCPEVYEGAGTHEHIIGTTHSVNH